ncbi:hypothetical protein [Actinomadura madurae]|uniref:hypothetical protein n=1 Tax=Actinomadura madurae TaxID=1993 RepID=UPI0020D22AC3|nr:hypothetical protein [Actinomadura madurae]MCP9980213.1 hypothetical protein [Actinomadura madurae]
MGESQNVSAQEVQPGETGGRQDVVAIGQFDGHGGLDRTGADRDDHGVGSPRTDRPPLYRENQRSGHQGHDDAGEQTVVEQRQEQHS